MTLQPLVLIFVFCLYSCLLFPVCRLAFGFQAHFQVCFFQMHFNTHLQLEFDIQGKLNLKLYDKRDDFNFPIVNFPFLSSNIPASPAYGVYVSQLIRYARASSEYRSFLHRGKLLTNKLLTQGYCKPRLIKTIKKFYIMRLWTNLVFLCPNDMGGF